MPACASIRDGLELATIRYIYLTMPTIVKLKRFLLDPLLNAVLDPLLDLLLDPFLEPLFVQCVM